MLLIYFRILNQNLKPLVLNVELDKAGVANGWANWPLEFDPIWVKTCDGFE
jgi:hypothetical protein